MIRWHQFPYVRIAIFYVAGIFIGLKTNVNSHLILYILLIAFGMLLFIFRKLSAYKYRLTHGFFIGAFLILLGILMVPDRINSEELDLMTQNQDYFLLITENPAETNKTYKIIGRLYPLSPSENKGLKPIKTITYFAKDSLASNISYGDLLKIHASFSAIAPPKNPHEFNYKKYLENHGIFFQAYIHHDSWRLIDRKQANPLKYYALKLRSFLLKAIQSKKITKAEFAVAAAILLGQDEILDDETRQDYAGAGAMHVLCVSGLHVGIIYLAFNALLGFLKRNRIQELIKMLCLIFIIWCYAMITGFSPSVLRASIMLSFIIIGNSLNKKGNIYNSIAASAFLLLLINPMNILEVGFQLSYAAVIGIISIYPILKKHLTHPNQIIDKILSILIVSLAAQIGTFPIAIFYFHQFPVYFLFTNLLVIALATFIINIGFLYLLFHQLNYLSDGLHFVFCKLIYGMNTYVNFIESLPFSTLQSLMLSLTEVVLLYLLIVGIIQSFLKKSKSWMLLGTLTLLLLISSFSISQFRHFNQQKLIVYQVAGSSAIEFQFGKNNLVLVDSDLRQQPQKMSYHLNPNWIYSSIKNPEIMEINEMELKMNPLLLIKHKNLIFFGPTKILIVDDTNSEILSDFQSDFDYLIISNNARIDLQFLSERFKPDLIILDSSNSKSYAEEKYRTAIKYNIPCYSVNLSGAIEINLNSKTQRKTT